MDAPGHRYGAALANTIQDKWRAGWEEAGTYLAPNPIGPLAEPNAELAGREAFYVLDMFPYPSGSGLHVGHPLGSSAPTSSAASSGYAGTTSCTRSATTRSGFRGGVRGRRSGASSSCPTGS